MRPIAKLQWGIIGMLGILLPCPMEIAAETVADSSLKPRIVVLTDIAPTDIEPDDMESMIRLLAHADLYEIEGLIATGGWNICGRTYPDKWMGYLQNVINAYEEDLPNLMKRSGQKGFLPAEKETGKQTLGYWPSAAYLRGRTAFGSRDLGVAKLGEENRSQGSKMIIDLVDEKDDRPLWVMVWGGANTLCCWLPAQLFLPLEQRHREVGPGSSARQEATQEEGLVQGVPGGQRGQFHALWEPWV